MKDGREEESKRKVGGKEAEGQGSNNPKTSSSPDPGSQETQHSALSTQHSALENLGTQHSKTGGLPRSAIIIGLVSLMADTSSEMIYPILPLFLTQTLNAPATVVGLIEGIAVGTASIVSGVSGWISDRIGRRKPVAFVGYSLTAISRPMIALAAAWPVVLGARFADRFGKGIRGAPRDALLAESAPEDQRGRAFGFERAMDSTGAVVGPIIGLLLLGWAGINIRTIFFISAVPAVIAALLILAVRERREDVVAGSKNIKLSLAGTTREYRRLLLIIGIFGLANSANAFLILRAAQLGRGDLSSAQMGSEIPSIAIMAYAFYNLVSALFSMPAGVASDRLGRRDLLVVGYIIYAASYVGFAAANAAWMVWPLFAIYGLFPALSDGVAKAMVVDTAGKAGRGTVIGIYSAVVGITQIAASLIGGLLWDSLGSWATFGFGAALAAIAALLLLALFPSRMETGREATSAA